jgi:hypothetical protein
VGAYFAGVYLPYSETWNGTTWTVHSIPGPAGGQFNGIACMSATSCIAVGTAGNLPLAEAWDGTSWTVLPTPLPAGAPDGDLTAVSCSSTTACLAVGVTTHATRPLAELWNGTSWIPHRTPHLASASRSGLNGVSCTHTGRCTAVGWQFVKPHQLPLAEHWNGTRFTVQATVYPPRSQLSDLFSVSCPSANICTAVGLAVTRTGQGIPLAEQSS